ncbi:MAG: VWA domain-containing protein [Clostridiales bacterium]|nr:VWA domain-containing protein [Clostridiales bacterium]
MFCTKCGTELHEGDFFCSKCGASQTTMTSVTNEQSVQNQQPSNAQSMNEQSINPQPSNVEFTNMSSSYMQTTHREPKPLQQQVTSPVSSNEGNHDSDKKVRKERKKGSTKKILIPIVVVLAILLVAAGIFGGIAFTRTNTWKEYLATYRNFPDQVESLGNFEEDYKAYLKEAEDFAAHYKFWEYENQKKKMEELCEDVKELNKAIEGYLEVYESVVAEIDDSGKYFLDDYEKEYKYIKEAFTEDLEAFDEDACRKDSKKFEKIRDDIKDYNQSIIASYDETITDFKESGNNNYYEVELELLTEKTNSYQEAVASGNYNKIRSSYQDFMELKGLYDNVPDGMYSLGDYIQMDVSEEKIIRLYYSGSDMNWDPKKIRVYEYGKKHGWYEDIVLDLKRIKGNMTIDLVADISTSLYDQFDEMKNSVTSFVNSTDADTKLGLSIISSTYRREATFTTNKNSIVSKVNDLYCEGCTSLYQSLHSSVLYTASNTGARCVVAFTDGRNEPYITGYDYTADDVIEVAQKYQVPVYIIGIGSNVDSVEMERIANATGGRFYSNRSASELYGIYNEIYSKQADMYELSYQSKHLNKDAREVYMYYYDAANSVGFRTQFKLEPAVVQSGYSLAGITSSDDLLSYYTNQKHLAAEDISSLSSIDDLQTVINIYYAKNGYKFKDSTVLQTMQSLGVIKQNGSLDGVTAEANIKKDEVLYSNYKALQIARYEWIYSVTREVYWEYYGNISLNEIEQEVNSRLNQKNGRFNHDIKKSYEDLIRY